MCLNSKILIPGAPVTPEAGSMYFTSSGYPYIYRNGVAYFHMPEVASVQQPWPVSNLFLYIFFLRDQDERSVFKSFLLSVSLVVPHV